MYNCVYVFVPLASGGIIIPRLRVPFFAGELKPRLRATDVARASFEHHSPRIEVIIRHDLPPKASLRDPGFLSSPGCYPDLLFSWRFTTWRIPINYHSEPGSLSLLFGLGKQQHYGFFLRDSVIISMSFQSKSVFGSNGFAVGSRMAGETPHMSSRASYAPSLR
jgi:hypothetical protein